MSSHLSADRPSPPPVAEPPRRLRRTYRHGQTTLARALTGGILGLFVVAAIGEGFACAYLWDQLTQTRNRLANVDDSTASEESESPEKDGDSENGASEDGAEAATAQTVQKPNADNAGNENGTDSQPYDETDAVRYELESEVARLQADRQLLARDNARLQQRLQFLTQRLDAIVVQREQLSAENREYAQRLALSSAKDHQQAEGGQTTAAGNNDSAGQSADRVTSKRVPLAAAKSDNSTQDQAAASLNEDDGFRAAP